MPTQVTQYNFDKIEINNWDFFRVSLKMRLFINGEEFLLLGRERNNISKFTKFFELGKFFTFVLLDKDRGLKILHSDVSKYAKHPQETLRRVIKIQKALYEKGVAFDCEEEIFPVYITDRAKKLKRKYYAYITHTDIDFSRLTESRGDVGGIFPEMMNKVYNEAKINRRSLGREMCKRANYVITNNGDMKFIDIDPRHYFKERGLSEDLKKEIVDESQFPYKRRKRQYQSIDEEDMAGIRNMGHRYFVLNLPDSFWGKRVLDIGCNFGMVCIMAKQRGADLCVGLDHCKETIEVAQKYLDVKGYNNIELVTYDINKGLGELIPLIGPDKFDYVFALSIWKHVDKPKLYEIINYYCKEKCWFEGHSKQTQSFFETELSKNLNFSQIKFLGNTTDRKTRPNFLLEK